MKNVKTKTEQLKEMMYQDSLIHFAFTQSNKNVMVNATEMAKVFGKKTKYFMETKDTKETISALERSVITDRSDVKIVDNRGHMGIYFHRLLAIDFASWLDKDFKVWMLIAIENILFGKINSVKSSINNIKSAEQKLEEAIELAKKENNKSALAIIDAYNERESAKKSKDKAMRIFTRQMKMDL